MKNLKYIFSVVLLSALALIGCGPKDEKGEVIIGLTDAQGDFIAYSVDVVKLTLTKANGAVVDTLPESTRIDFAQYVDMTEFLTAATIPSGVYTKATLTLDYSNADIQVEGADGTAQKVTSILDANGNAVTQVDVSVQLKDRNRLAIVPGVPAVVTFDFDLAATNKVEFAGETPTMTVEPMLVAGIDAEFDKNFRLRGLLKNVDTAQNTFSVVVRPLFHALKNGDERFGVLKVATSDTTKFDISGEAYSGSDGVVALSALDKTSAVIINGTMNFSTRTFNATEVTAGDSVPGATKDVITGNVIKRQGNTLTLRGATLERAQGAVTFHDTVSVLLTDATTVRRAGANSNETFNIGDISVGQRLIALGTLDTTASNTTLNANHVRMMVTSVRGEVTQVNGNQINLSLHSIDNRRIGLFDFTGTGATSTQYEIDASTLTSDLSVGNVVRIMGFPIAFGTQTPDFTAKTVVKVNDVRAVLNIGWGLRGTSTPFSSTASDSFQLDLPNSGLVHHVVRAGVRQDLNDFGVDPTIKLDSGFTPMLITQGREATMHTVLANFISDVNSRLAAGAKAYRIVAIGGFDDTTASLTTKRMQIILD